MPTSPKKFGAVLPNDFAKLPIEQQETLQRQLRDEHTSMVHLTGQNYAEPLKKGKRKRRRSQFTIFVE
jgi:hypothetical protein